MAQNRARNDASNRVEFLQSFSERRQKLVSDTVDSRMDSVFESTSSCARTDARALDRDVQMKYDIAKNEEGPLRRTVKVGMTFQDGLDSKGKQPQTAADDGSLGKERYSGVDERLLNLETHVSIRYGERCLWRSCSARKAQLCFAAKYLRLHNLYLTDLNSWKTI